LPSCCIVIIITRTEISRSGRGRREGKRTKNRKSNGKNQRSGRNEGRREQNSIAEIHSLHISVTENPGEKQGKLLFQEASTVRTTEEEVVKNNS
jgi:hypothetical protein